MMSWFGKRKLIEEKQQLRERIDALEQKLSAASRGQAKAEGVLAAIAAPTFTVDRDLVITSINDAALAAMGYRREEVVGRMTCAEFSKTPLCGTANCTLKNCMRSGEVIVGETVAETRDGRKIPIKAACSPCSMKTAWFTAAWKSSSIRPSWSRPSGRWKTFCAVLRRRCSSLTATC